MGELSHRPEGIDAVTPRPAESSAFFDPRGLATDVRVETRNALALGIRIHGPDCVGLFARTLPVWAAALFARFILGAPTWAVAAGFACTVAFVLVWSLTYSTRRDR